MEFATIFRLTPCKATVQPSHNKRTVRCAQSCQVRTLQPGKGFSFLYSVSAKPLNMVLPPAMTQFPHICRLPSIGLALATRTCVRTGRVSLVGHVGKCAHDSAVQPVVDRELHRRIVPIELERIEEELVRDLCREVFISIDIHRCTVRHFVGAACGFGLRLAAVAMLSLDLLDYVEVSQRFDLQI